MVPYCSDCGAELVADIVSTVEGPDWYCPNCDDTFWKRLARQRKLEKAELTYETFLRIAKDVFNSAKEDRLYDLNEKELTRTNFPNGLYLAMHDGKHYIACKIMVGTKKQVEDAFECPK